MTRAAPAERLIEKAHRDLDELLGRLLQALSAGESPRAGDAARRFDDELRRHTEAEEDLLFPRRAGRKLLAEPGETEIEGLCRELRIEHVQLRELSGMIARLAAVESDLAGALHLVGNLARRWDAHTTREERELAGRLPLGPQESERLRQRLEKAAAG